MKLGGVLLVQEVLGSFSGSVPKNSMSRGLKTHFLDCGGSFGEVCREIQ